MNKSKKPPVQKTIEWAKYLKDAIDRPGKILEAYQAFHDYSLNNRILAQYQCFFRGIDLGIINTFKRWKDKGRTVRKGEKAIELMMPFNYKKELDAEDEKSGVGFMMRRRWFVISQTEGETVEPEPIPEWDIKQAMATLDIEETKFDLINGNIQGFACKRKIAINPVAALPNKTRFHEMAHIILGHTAETSFMSDSERTPQNIREVEAESVAMICCATFELEGIEYSRGYIQSWLKDETISDESAQKIFSAANKIINAGQIKEEVAA